MDLSQIQEIMHEQYISKYENKVQWSHPISHSRLWTASYDIFQQEHVSSHFAKRAHDSIYSSIAMFVCQNLLHMVC